MKKSENKGEKRMLERRKNDNRKGQSRKESNWSQMRQENVD